MLLTSLHLEGFRSYDRAVVALDPSTRTHVLLGNNGAGKTNIVEAISFLSQGRSCLGVAPDLALRWGATHYRLRAACISDAGEALSIEYVFQVQPTRAIACFVRDVRVPYAQFIGRLPVVTFLPQHLDLFVGPPTQRRAFLDALLAQLDPEFLRLRLRFERTLTQRNTLLRAVQSSEASIDALDAWDREYATLGAAVQSRRFALTSTIAERLPPTLHALGEQWSSIDFRLERGTQATDASLLVDEICAFLQARRSKDIAAGMTTSGPHRDDWTFTVDGHPFGSIASRGQQRAAFLALLFIAVSLCHERTGERPIVLLDDVFSELDVLHQHALLARCEGMQTIMTTAHALPELPGAFVYAVADGALRLVQ